MKQLRLLLLLVLGAAGSLRAQLPNGSIAPDFITTDIDGATHNLYGLLNQEKTVFLDIFATWCGPCWNYHNSHALANLWDQYGPPGTDQAYVMAIEGDAATNVACIYGPSGCVGGTQGDWTAGTPYPICDDAGVANLYQINYFPTIYCICPYDQKAYVCGQLSTGGLWAFRNANCAAPPIQLSLADVQSASCFGSNTGMVDIDASGGVPPYVYNWSNGMHTQDLVNVPAGNYMCTVSSGGGQTAVIGPINVPGPSGPMTATISNSTPIGCTVAGTITAAGNGGWGNYTYQWSNGQTEPTCEVLAAGVYNVTITDDGGCTKTASKQMTAPVNPTANIASPQLLSCSLPAITLDGTSSTSGPDISYLWTTATGNILSGSTTATPTVNAAGTYTLRVTNDVTGCYGIKNTVVNSNISLPVANAGPNMAVTCATTTAQLQGSGDVGPNFTYLWTTLGGNIQSGAGTLTPTVSAGGTYVLNVTNTLNGCSKTDTTIVAANNVPPSVAIAAPGTLTCATTSTALNTTTDASTPAFAWSGPNGWASTEQNPSVNVAGQYSVVVTNPATGCTNSQSATVAANTTAPGATASGGTLTCTTTSLQITGGSSATGVNYAWSGPNGWTSTAQNPTVDASGQYNLVVTSPDNGCTSAATASVNANTAQPAAAAAAPGNLNCNASQLQLNGTASSQGSNFTYAWTASNGGQITGGENTLTPTVNAAGSYSILVTNTDNGCTNTASTSVSQSPQVTAAVSGQSNVSCNGNTDGSATATAGGGFGAFTFHWSNGATTSSISGLATGNYLVTVTDTENCSATASVAITQPDPLVCNAIATAQTQSGTDDGTATANPTGGTPGFSYAWSNGGTTQTITDLAPGAYTVVITDANGCTQSQTVTVNSVNCALVPSIAGTNISCFGAADGSATVSLLGANEPVTYTWSNGQTSATATNLTPGNYSVQILDAGGCPAEISVSIAQPVQLSASASATGESAQGANDGTASATAIGGTGTYTYLWSNGATTASISGLAPGTYSVEVKDENGCASVQEVVVPAFTCALQTDLAVANVNCAGGTDGQATVLVNGGAAPYTYLWSNGQTTATATGLSVGNYSVQILDASGCETAGNVQVTEPTPLAIDLVGQTNVACPDDNTGEASIEANGGTGTFSYLWSNGQTTSTATGLTAGDHTVQVTDANGCQQTRTVTITANDIVPPVLVLQNATVPVGPNGLTGNLMDYIVTTMTDNCTVALVSFAPAQFDCSQLGQQSVEVTVMDAAGNAVSSTAQVLVVDETAPTVACPASVTKCYYENVVSYPAPSATDNCSGGQWALTSGLQSGATFPVGVTTQTYQYTDASGNAGNCSFDIIIVSPTEITAVETAGCFESCEGSLTVLGTAGGQQPVAFAWSNGQSGSTATGLCNNEITLTLTDNAGCRTQQTPVFDVPEPLDLQVVSISNDVNNQQVGSANINVEGGEQPYSYVWTNAAGQIVSTSEDLTNVGAGSYNVQVTDANGCEIANSQTIVVQNTVGTAEPTWAKGMKLVPNPTPGLVQLRFVEQPAADMEIAIVDATGRQLLTVVSVGERVVDLDLSYLPEGIYSVRLRMEGAVAVKKVVLSH